MKFQKLCTIISSGLLLTLCTNIIHAREAKAFTLKMTPDYLTEPDGVCTPDDSIYCFNNPLPNDLAELVINTISQEFGADPDTIQISSAKNFI